MSLALWSPEPGARLQHPSLYLTHCYEGSYISALTSEDPNEAESRASLTPVQRACQRLQQLFSFWDQTLIQELPKDSFLFLGVSITIPDDTEGHGSPLIWADELKAAIEKAGTKNLKVELLAPPATVDKDDMDKFMGKFGVPKAWLGREAEAMDALLQRTGGRWLAIVDELLKHREAWHFTGGER